MKKGYAIIESLVAITILVGVIIGGMGAVQSALSSYSFSKEQVQAFYLAQEAFEQLRNVRDENILNGRNWIYGIANNSSDPCYFGYSCAVSPVETSTLSRCPSLGGCAKLRQNTSGFYGYNASWTETIFTRDIKLTSIGTDEVTVSVTITWQKGLSTRTFSARENLLNW